MVGDIISERWARSSRNAWAASSRNHGRLHPESARMFLLLRSPTNFWSFRYIKEALAGEREFTLRCIMLVFEICW